MNQRQAAFIARLRQSGPEALDAGTVVLLPSLSFSMAELAKITGVVHYEERLLCMTLHLRHPRLHMVYITSMAVDPAIVDYYLGFLPDPADPRHRLHMVALDDPDVRPLSDKLLDRPDVLARITALAGAGDDGYIMPFNVTGSEQALSEALALPLFGAPPELAWLGSKTGSKRSARQAGVLVLQGREDLWDLTEISKAIELIRDHAPHAEAVVIKLNDGFAGQGNAIVELELPVRPLPETETTFCGTGESWPSFEAKIAAGGAIVEELVRNEEMVSPSVQLRVIPGRPAEVLSTHDQILGGPQGQVYIGCRFPADPSYRLIIQENAAKVGQILADHGVIGTFGIDFLVAPGRRGNAVYLSEINLRMGGTTHPFWMAKLVADGRYDPTTGELIAATGPKRYVASDNLLAPDLIGRTPGYLIDAIERAGLGFDPATGTGVTLHLLGAVPEYGKFGVTCIADTLDDAETLYAAVLALIIQESVVAS
ncbi:MAG: peptide ligase PGM1-related protein [Actinomycetota bacterium]|nr:peptide ligase PGM1-related protein [Actinomycetota bacterium]